MLRLTAEPLFEVIGNAPELRTPRPFQDLRLVRDRVGARFIVIGQLQRSGDGFRVMAHLIRAADLVHLWAEAIPISADPPRAGDDQVADRIVGAVLTKAR